VPLHLRLVLVNGLVFALGVFVLSMAPQPERGPVALGVLLAGLAAIIAVNTRYLRHGLAPLLALAGALRSRWESERRMQSARSQATKEYDGQRVAAELHDNVADHLNAALVSLRKALHHAPPELAEELRSVQHRAQLGLVEVRRIGRRLRPELLEDLGFQSALAALVAKVSTRNGSVRVHRHLEGPFHGLSADTELVIYRVAEEALENISRHAKASRVGLSLRPEGRDLVVLRVTDDGVGLHGARERSGIHGMRERAALVGGSLTVTPREGGGTEVRLQVPR
jgi:two-component system sensor histidine kinase UhpB